VADKILITDLTDPRSWRGDSSECIMSGDTEFLDGR
jgi:hypothetical protein